MLRYLGRYTHRVAISNHRLLSFDGEHVTFRWRDYAHGNKQKKMTLTAMEFLRRLSHHILPRGFVRIRHFGFLTNTRRSALLAVARQLIATVLPSVEVCAAAAVDHKSDLAMSALSRAHAYRSESVGFTAAVSMPSLRQLISSYRVSTN